jgi:DNA-binding NarL/FixJ family response regulator
MRPLTARQTEVLRLIASGRLNKQIAGEMGITTKTVENHRSALMRKLDLHNIALLTLFAVRSGIVDPAAVLS